MTTSEALLRIEAISQQLRAFDKELGHRREWQHVHRLISLVGIALEVLMDYLTEKLKSEKG